MSPGGTMMRVYDALKARILTGSFRPGDRLDPARLARQLSASATPVRDALHRLSGEGLVDSLQQEGFRTPRISEAAIRDRYEWSADLMAIVSRAAFRNGVRPRELQALPDDYALAVAQSFTAIALLSPNHEHRHAVASLVDRSASFRSLECEVLPSATDDVRCIATAIANAEPVELRHALDQFHRSRMRQVATLVAKLRDHNQVL